MVALIFAVLALLLHRINTVLSRVDALWSNCCLYQYAHHMFVLYYALFVPTGLVMKLFGRDALARTTGGKNTDSYRVASAVRPNDHFERPY